MSVVVLLFGKILMGKIHWKIRQNRKRKTKFIYFVNIVSDMKAISIQHCVECICNTTKIYSKNSFTKGWQILGK